MSEGGTASARVREQLDRARAILGGCDPVSAMPKREARMVSLGYGKFVKADRVYALVPIEAERARRRPPHLRARRGPRPADRRLALRARDPRGRRGGAHRGGRACRGGRRRSGAKEQENLF